MIKELRRKFVVVSVSIVIGVIMTLSILSNLATYIQINKHSDVVLDILIENDGKFPKLTNLLFKISPETPFTTRYFTIIADDVGSIEAVDIGQVEAIETEQAITYAAEVLNDGSKEGRIDDYKYIVAEKDYGQLMVFVDCSREREMFKSFLLSGLPVFVSSVVLVFILALIFSKEATKSIVESYEKQKRFITDVSHELKTPLAIIQTNTEVLDMYYSENEWTKSILNNTNRLSQLVESLVTLTRMDEEKSEIVTTTFSLSDAIFESAKPFETFALANNKKIILEIESQLSYHGNESSIRQLIGIFLDNAIKYANPNSDIIMKLQKQGKKLVITVSNETDELKQGNYDRLLERFYREDTSRNSKTGGYGIGLSIAKAITQQHKGKITAESPDGKVFIMTVVL